MMTLPEDTGAPEWLDTADLDPARADLYEGWLAAGKVMRCAAASPALRSEATEVVPALLERGGLWQVTDQCNAEAERALEILERLAAQEEQDPLEVYELALLRDDLQSVALSISSVLVNALDAEPALREQADLAARQVKDLCQAVDRQARPRMERVWVRRRALSEPPPGELTDMVAACGPNPWWLELADPLLAEPLLAEPLLAEPLLAEPLLAEPLLAEPLLAEPLLAEPLLAATRPLVDDRLAAGSGALELAVVRLQRGATLRITRTARGEIELVVRDPEGVLEATTAQLSWDTGDGEDSVDLEPYTPGLFRKVCARDAVAGLLRSTLALVRQQETVLVVERPR